MQELKEMWVRSLGWEDPLEEGMATHSSILTENLMDREAWEATVHGVKRVGRDWSDSALMQTHSSKEMF